jgi:Zn-finger nucleic acid-binding protein
MSPSLLVNGENYDSAIINFESDYGYDRSDRDVLMGEFKIELQELNQSQSEINITGQVRGVYLDEPETGLWNTDIKLLDKNRNIMKEFRADTSGFFQIQFDNSEERILEFNFIGWRTIFIDVNKLLTKIN